MVSTRSSSVRGDSVDPDLSANPSPSSPTKRSTPRSRSSLTKAASTTTATNNDAQDSASSSTFQHTPTPFTLIWLAISLPLVAWDTCYVLGRPHTMEGGSLHWPLWVPYKLYGTVDHIYGWPAYEARNGFTSAQGFLNVVETVMYLAYLWLCLGKGAAATTGGGGAGAGDSALGAVVRKVVTGRTGAAAVLIGFSAAVMTLSKTVLYWANEYFSGFGSIGHNPFMDLLFLWIIPNGAWLVGSTYMIWSLGGEILEGLAPASSHAKSE